MTSTKIKAAGALATTALFAGGLAFSAPAQASPSIIGQTSSPAAAQSVMFPATTPTTLPSATYIVDAPKAKKKKKGTVKPNFICTIVTPCGIVRNISGYKLGIWADRGYYGSYPDNPTWGLQPYKSSVIYTADVGAYRIFNQRCAQAYDSDKKLKLRTVPNSTVVFRGNWDDSQWYVDQHSSYPNTNICQWWNIKW